MSEGSAAPRGASRDGYVDWAREVRKTMETGELQALLERREDELVAAIRAERTAFTERTAEGVGGGNDRGDEAMADLLADTEGANASRHFEELRAVREALGRLRGDSYGVCEACGEPIPYERLLVEPTAVRCVACQERYDSAYAHGGRSAL